ncbi:transposase [Streptomyces sp. NPDC093568]|uniref:transposase n=1 Tax=Streptomyces sp. NPDC093568 TaxID=3366041 RepID=UPI00382FD0CD
MLEPLLLRGKNPGRPLTWARRQLIDGIRFRIRTGVPWRDMPAEYGPWGRVYDLFRRWQRDGNWHRIFTASQARADANERITWDLNPDSTIVRAHQHGAGAGEEGSPNRNRLAVWPASRRTTGQEAPAAVLPPSCWPSNRGRSPCPS